MPGVPNDTTTGLNPGTGGDSMDESQVTQSNGTTTAKRPRVVPGGDDGSLQSFDEGPEATEGRVRDRDVESLLAQILTESKRQTALLRLLLGKMGDENVSIETIDEFTKDGD